MNDPTCHSKLKGLHPDMSSGAAEIYAASVALTEVLHLSYIVEEMGESMELPLQLLVDMQHHGHRLLKGKRTTLQAEAH